MGHPRRLPRLVPLLAAAAGACAARPATLPFRADFVRHAPPATLRPTYRTLSGNWRVAFDRLRQTGASGGVLRVALEIDGPARVEIGAFGYGGAPGAGVIFGVGPGDALEGATAVTLLRDGVAVGVLDAAGAETVAERASAALDTLDEHTLLVVADPASKRLRVEVDGAALLTDAAAPGRLAGGVALRARGAQSFSAFAVDEAVASAR